MKIQSKATLIGLVLSGLLVLVPMNAFAQAPQPGAGSQSPQTQQPGAPGSTQTPGTVPDQTGPQMSQVPKADDPGFAKKAAQGGLAEVELGKLAAQKASDPDVKAFGQQMVDDHGKINDQLKEAAQQSKLTLPDSPSSKQQSQYQKLQSLSGPAFDKAYVKAMVKDHSGDVKEFKNEASSGQDPQIKSFASQALPTIQAHLDKIKSIQSKLNSSGSAKAGSGS